MGKRKTPADVVAENAANILLEHLKKGTMPWTSNLEKSKSVLVPGRPKSLGGYHYSNMTNELILTMQQYVNDGYGNLWASPKQIRDKGGRINPGDENNGTVVLRTFRKYLDTRDNKVKNYPFDEEEAKRIGADKMPPRWTTIYSKVFNVAGQTTGLPAKYYPEIFKYDPQDKTYIAKVDKKVQKLLDHNSIELVHEHGPLKVFTPHLNLLDKKIYIPKKELFDNGFIDYSKTLFHECGHFSGLKSLLGYNSDTVDKKTSHYAIEELRAELSSVVLSGHFKLPNGHHMENHAAYVKSWIRHIEDDPKILIDISKDSALGFNFLTKNKPEYRDMLQHCDTEFDRHVLCMCIAKGKTDPESMMEKVADAGKAGTEFFITKFHAASLARSYPDQMGVDSGYQFDINMEKETFDEMIKSYQNSVVESCKSIVLSIDLDFQLEFGFENEPAQKAQQQSMPTGPKMS